MRGTRDLERAGYAAQKHIGYIDSRGAEELNHFYCNHLNPYLNYHRPCAQSEASIDAKGRKCIRYRHYRTPLATLLVLLNPTPYLRPGLNTNALLRIAASISDTDAPRRMQQAEAKLFDRPRPEPEIAAARKMQGIRLLLSPQFQTKRASQASLTLRSLQTYPSIGKDSWMRPRYIADPVHCKVPRNLPQEAGGCPIFMSKFWL